MTPLRKMEIASRRPAIAPTEIRRHVRHAIRIAREIKVREHIGVNVAYTVLRKYLPAKIAVARGVDNASFSSV